MATLELCWYCSSLGLSSSADSVTHFLFGKPGPWLASRGHSQFTRSSCPELPSWLWLIVKLQDSNGQGYFLPPARQVLKWASPSGPGHGWGSICTGACLLPQAHKLMVGLFSSMQLLKVIINLISHLILHIYLSFLSAYFFTCLLFVAVSVSFCCYIAPKSQWLTTVTHSQFLQLKVNCVLGQFSLWPTPPSSPAQTAGSGGCRLGSASWRY